MPGGALRPAVSLGFPVRANGRKGGGMRGGLALAAIMMCAAPESAEHWPDADWQVLDTKVRWAVARGLDTIPLGAAIARLGETFVGTTYTPGTLEVPGPERVVINLREFDCEIGRASCRERV